MKLAVDSQGQNKTLVSIKGPDGKIRNLGRVDAKFLGLPWSWIPYWAPRAQFYRYVTFPRLVRNLNDK